MARRQPRPRAQRRPPQFEGAYRPGSFDFRPPGAYGYSDVVGFEQFFRAIMGQESGGNFGARNKASGAFGAFQIMPKNWDKWAAEAGLSPSAPKTRANQIRVAKAKMLQYYQQYGDWGAVAAAWYGGPKAAQTYLTYPRHATLLRQQKSGPSVSQYVSQVLSRMGQTRGPAATYQKPKGILDPEQAKGYAGQLAQQFGLRITSAKRSAAHNAKVGGAKKSDHLTGYGFDFAGTPQQMAAFARFAKAASGKGKLFRYVEYGTKSHRDHVHVSFWSPDKMGQGSKGLVLTPVPQDQAVDEFGMPLSDDEMAGMVTAEGGIAEGFQGDSEADFIKMKEDESKALYPALKDYIDFSRGQTPKAFTKPYATVMSELLELPIEEFDLRNPRWKKVIDKPLPDGGRTTMTLWEWENMLRTDASYGWDKTRNAHEDVGQFATQILKSFGFTG